MPQDSSERFDSRDGNLRESVSRCLFCESDRHEPAIVGMEDYFFDQVEGSFDMVRCCDCGSLWQPERLKSEHIGEAYRQYYTHDDEPPAASGGLKGWIRQGYMNVRLGGSRNIADLVGSALYKRLAPNLQGTELHLRCAPPAPASILDYGCGSGAYLKSLQPYGFDLHGIDFDPVSVEKVRSAGIECSLPDDVNTTRFGTSFDFITLSHVIEHVYDPRQLLCDLHDWMKPGGSLFIEVPNAQAQGLDVFGKYWRGLESPRHLSLPSPDGLYGAIESAGLEVTDVFERSEVRDWLWQVSAKAVPPEERERIEARCSAAADGDAASAEFITLIARKPAR